ncbi:MAG: hypothetical protein ACE5G3_01820 [Gammaproteobacteria bacterium]
MSRTLTLLATIAGMLMAAGTARADWVSPAFYSDELGRCTVELRSRLGTPRAAGLRHTVTDIDKTGVWYVFDIQTDVVDDAGAVIDRVQTRCNAHRWNEQTRIRVKGRSATVGVRFASAD